MNAAFMDFGSLFSLNNKNGIDWKKYPLEGCRFHGTLGSLELGQKKKQRIFPTKDASIRVVLHENHRIYYSSETGEYRPFTLPPTEGDIRHSIQSHFRDKY